jgi:hypothetical protein
MGAEKTENATYFVLTAETDWEGNLVFDAPRHKTILHLPIDYPRINQFPEWFTAEDEMEFAVVSSQKSLSGKYTGKLLTEGIPVKLKAGEQLVFSVKSN